MASRRDFLKNASIATAAMASSKVVPGFGAQTQNKSKVVIARDPDCVTIITDPPNSQGIVRHYVDDADTGRIQDMVDHVIMELMGINDRGAAYEALFPEQVTSDTEIIIKKNGISGSASTSNSHVLDALKNGLMSMLGGTFPENRINITRSGGNTRSGDPQFMIGNHEYIIKSGWVDSNWIINAPVCWAHGDNHGVTMSLKNMMSCVGGSGLNRMHGYPKDSDYPWMSVLNSQDTFKTKQKLVLMDAITGRADDGPGGNADFAAYSILGSTDMVACDYQGLLILLENGNAGNGLNSARESSAREIFRLAAQSPYNLGTNSPDDMEVVEIQPPWQAVITRPGEKPKDLNFNLSVIPHSGRTEVRFIFAKALPSNPQLKVFNIKGHQVWSSNDIDNSALIWPGTDTNGHALPAGMYSYWIKGGKKDIRGKIQIIK